MSAFNINNIAQQKGRVAVVTGANIGLGYETALSLAQKKMTVVLACRNMEKAKAAKTKITTIVPYANIDILAIDLSKLASVRDFAAAYLAKYDRLDILINNAGVMMPPFTLTEDGFELQMAANYFGHFLLTGLLLDTIIATPKSRIVSLSSLAHKNGNINFNDLQSEQHYVPMKAYSQSKLACLMYAYELQRHLNTMNTNTISVAAHPGVAYTNLMQHFPSWLLKYLVSWALPLITHSPKSGAEPTLYAALGTDVQGGDYFGPNGFREMAGRAAKTTSTKLSHNKEIAKRLWEVSETLTGYKYF